MPQWRPAPATLVRQFETAIAAVPGAELRNMFGYPAAFVRGHMVAGLFQEHLIVRLSPQDRAELASHPEARPFEPIPGRPMREYLIVPAAIRETPSELERWLARASGFVGSLPPKARRTVRSAKKKPPQRTPR
jgi:TfoX/Sxy family transcriptional regulator of competence genes